jgi:hypothetical protein
MSRASAQGESETKMDHRDELDAFQESFDRLQEAVDTYLAANPYKIVGENEPRAREYRLRLIVTEKPPYRLRTLAGQAIGNLRNALDYLARAVVEANGPPKRPQRVQFPIFPSRERFDNGALGPNGQIAEASLAAQAAFEALQPYHGGNPVDTKLWTLHQLARKHRHKEPVIVGSFYRRGLASVRTTQVPATIITQPERITFKHGAIIARVLFGLPPGAKLPRNLEMEVDLRVQMTVALQVEDAPMNLSVDGLKGFQQYIRNTVFPALEPFI